MLRLRHALFSQKCAIASLPYNVLKSYSAAKSSGSSLRTYLKSIKDPNHIKDSELNEILALLRRDPLVDIDAIEVLKCCSSEHIQQTHVLDDIWTELKSKSVPLNVQHYNALLRIYIQKEKMFSPRALFDEIIGRGMNPNVSTCNLMILSYALKGDVHGAIEALEDAQKHEIKINPSTFNNLILAHANAGDINGMNEVFTTMKAKAMPVDCDTLNNLLKGYAKIGDTDKLNVTFGLFETENVELLNSDIFNVIFHLDANGHSDKIDEFFKRLFKSMEYRHSARAFITQSVQSRRSDLIEKLLVNNADRCPLPTLARHYLTEAANASYAENDINQIWQQLETFNVTIESNIEVFFPDALRSSSTPLVKATLNGMKAQSVPIRDEHFNHLCHLESAKGSEAVLDVMRLMRFEFDVRPRCTAIRDTFLPLYEYSKRPQMALAKLLTLDLSITTILTAVITRCILDKRWNDAVEIANMYKKHYFMATQYRPYFIQAVQDTEDVDSLVKFLRILHDDAERLHSAAKVPASKTTQPTTEQMLEELYFGSADMDGVHVVGEIIHDAIARMKGDLDKSEKLLERLLSEGLQISKECASKMQRQLGVSKDSALASLLDRLSAANLKPQTIPKPSHFISPLKLLTPDELVTLIELAESRGKSVAGSKRLLFEAYVSENNLLAAEELLQDSSIRPSKRMYANLISLCLDQRDVDKAVDYFERAQTDCQPFYLHRTQAAKMVVLLLLRNHKFEEIQQMMLAKGVKYSFVKAKTSLAAVNLLQDISDSGDIHLTQELFKHLKENDYIEPTVKSTGALVNVHLQNDNIVEAFNAFEEIFSKYQFTPLKMNLLCKLIQKDDMNRLQQVVEIVAGAQGENIALRALAYAFIEADQIEQASIVLSNPVLVQGFNFLRRDCDYFYQRNQIKILKGLLKATENLDYDCTEIYRYLFLHFCKTNETQRGTKHAIRKKLSPDEFLSEITELLNLEEPKSIIVIEKIENVIAETALKAVETVVSSSEEEQLNDKLMQLISQDTEHISEASEMILAALESNVKIDQTVISLFLNKAAEMGVTSVYDELWNNSDARNLPNFNNLYLQAHLNGATPIRYIQKMEKLFEHAKSGVHQQHDNVDSFVRIDDNLRFLQEHPHVINEYETMAIKATDVKIYAPINVVWMYHFMSESPFIESLWTQHFASQPEIFQTGAMLQILEEGKCHLKLRKFVDFLVANKRLTDAASVQNARLRNYVNENCFAEANQVVKTSVIPVNFLDQTLLDEVRQHSETSSTPNPNPAKRVRTENVHELFQE